MYFPERLDNTFFFLENDLDDFIDLIVYNRNDKKYTRGRT